MLSKKTLAKGFLIETVMNKIEHRFFKEETGLDYHPDYESIYEIEVLEARAAAKVTVELMREAWLSSKEEVFFNQWIKEKYGVL